MHAWTSWFWEVCTHRYMHTCHVLEETAWNRRGLGEYRHIFLGMGWRGATRMYSHTPIWLTHASASRWIRKTCIPFQHVPFIPIPYLLFTQYHQEHPYDLLFVSVCPLWHICFLCLPGAWVRWHEHRAQGRSRCHICVCLPENRMYF